MENSILEIKNFSYTYPQGDRTVLNRVSMTIGPGECHCITGPTGSGKSTLIMAIKGLLANGRTTGDIKPPRQAQSGTTPIGIVLQNPETQVLGDSLGTEMAFGLENLGVLPEKMEEKILTQLSAVGLDKPLNGPVSSLSTGEKYRLILASVLVMDPHLMLIDEPGAQLDESGIGQLKKILEEFKASGKSVLICEHRPDFFSDLIDRYWRIDENGSLVSCPPANRANSYKTDTEMNSRSQSEKEVIIEVDHLTPKINGSAILWSDLTFSVGKGSKLAIYGPNGAGKTTLMRCIMGLVRPLKGSIRVFGQPPSLNALKGKIGCLFQNPQKQLFENTVREEIGFPLKRFGISKDKIDKKVDQLLEVMALSQLGDLSPHKLSFGQKHLVVLASILSIDPELLIMDDPYAGFDDKWKSKITDILESILYNCGTTLVWCGHQADENFPRADRTLILSRGQIEILN